MSETVSTPAAIIRLPVNMLRALTREQLLARHPKALNSTLNIDVRHILGVLWGDSDTFRRLVTSTTVENSVEGSPTTDRHVAAAMIRTYAEDQRIDSVAKANLTSVKRATGNALRFYELRPAA